ncbi:MAG: tetratricopeptide repeat protein [Bacteroidales bacterium]|nr:tetratricopeptide repeat protein [Bacteroidales bacterium]MDD3666080.1 tetratricopeptide repeat protein [Bacteroidales bacterium]
MHTQSSLIQRLVVFLLILPLHVLNGECQEIPQLNAQEIFRYWSGATDSISKARQLRAAALDSMEVNRYAASETILLKAKKLAETYGETRLLNNIMNNLAECYSLTGRSDKAFEVYFQLIERLRSDFDSSSLSSILINLGDEYAKTGQKAKAIETELEAIRIKEASGNLKRLAFFYQKLGELFIGTDADKWEFYTTKALELSRKDEQTTWYATIAIYNSLGGIWSDKKDYKKAEAYYDTMYRLAKEAGYAKGVLTAVSERALMFMNQSRYDKALPLAIEAHQFARNGDSEYNKIYSSTLLARIYLVTGRLQEATRLLEEASTRAKATGLVLEETEACKWLKEAYSMQGDWRKAFNTQARWVSLKDSTDGIEITQTINQLQTQYETEKKQQLIDRLSEQHNIQRKLTGRLQAMLGASAIALLMLFMVVWLLKKALKQNQAIHDKEQKILVLENERLTLDVEYKARELTAATLHLINKNEVLTELKEKLQQTDGSEPDLKQVVRKIDQNINLDNDWINFRKHFEQVHPHFFNRLKQKFPGLTPNEERLCAYLRINLNTKEISNMLNVTTAAVDKSRNRLRKKLEISPEVNLTEFITAI